MEDFTLSTTGEMGIVIQRDARLHIVSGRPKAIKLKLPTVLESVACS